MDGHRGAVLAAGEDPALLGGNNADGVFDVLYEN